MTSEGTATHDDAATQAEEQIAGVIGPVSTPTAFPAPPAYFRLYGPPSPSVRIAPLPPPRIHFGNLPMFGRPHEVVETEGKKNLQEEGCTQLYPDEAFETDETKTQLRQLNRSLVVSFVQLIDLLIQQPLRCHEKIRDIEIIFLNMNFLLNSFRPFQARLKLVSLLSSQLCRREQAIDSLKQALLETKTLLQSLAEELPSLVTDVDSAVAAAASTSSCTLPLLGKKASAAVSDEHQSTAVAATDDEGDSLVDTQRHHEQEADERLAALLQELGPLTDAKQQTSKRLRKTNI